jgi:hypothetical protein
MGGKRNVRRAPGWWPTRILLAVGIVSVVVIGVGLLACGGLQAGISDPRPALSLGPLLIPQSVAISIAAFVVPLFGLLWMFRIYRGPRDEPQPWRHRRR